MKHKNSGPRVFVDGKWVDKDIYRAWVYKGDERKVANNWQEYQNYLGTGEWFESKQKAQEALEKVSKKRKLKNEPNS